MAKHQKPKPSSAKGIQKNHNRATKGCNTKKKGPLWAIRRAIVRNKRTGETREIDVEVRVPVGSLWNPFFNTKKELPEPFDALKLDWVEEAQAYCAESNAKISRTSLPSGALEYKVIDKFGNIIFSVITERNAFIGHRQRRRRRRNSKK